MDQIIQLERNDVSGALATAEVLTSENRYGPDEEHALIMLQDDPAELIAALPSL